MPHSATDSRAHHDRRHGGLSLGGAQAVLRDAVRPLVPVVVPLPEAAGRIAAHGVCAEGDLPPFARAAVDGFALAASSVAAARPDAPVRLEVTLDVEPGASAPGALRPGETARVLTGSPLPEGADAVVMLEDVVEREDHILVSSVVARGKHAGARGEDVTMGDRLLAAGRRIRPDDLGLLAALGVRDVAIHAPPRVLVHSTGDELDDPLEGGPALPAHVFDANSYMLEALTRREGACVRRGGIIRDGRARIAQALLDARDVDVTITTGAASVGRFDVVPEIIADLGERWVNGVALRPGHPVSFGRICGRLHFALPGNPVAAWVGFRFFVRPALRLLAGERADVAFAPDRTFRAVLAKPYESVRGRTDVVRVVRGPDGTVEPIGAGGASRLTTLTRADGFILVPAGVEQLAAGASVVVESLD